MPETKAEAVLRLIKMKGPLIPIQITKEIGSNTMFAGAILSQLVDEKKAFLTSVKVGGSPVYYVGGQEPRLVEFYKYLNEKDRKTFDILKQKKVIRDSEQSPLIRFSLRAIKDYARPLEVKMDDSTEIFWKWYLVSDSEAETIIKEELKYLLPKEEIPVQKEMPKEEIKEVKTEIRKEEIKREMPKREEAKKITEFADEIRAEQSSAGPRKSSAFSREKEEVKKKIRIIDDDFLEKAKRFFRGKEIEIIEFKILRKNSEIEFVLKVPSTVGSFEYYCRAKNKKNVSDADLSSTYVQGQLKKMPAILLTTGELSKNAKELMSKEFKLNIIKI